MPNRYVPYPIQTGDAIRPSPRSAAPMVPAAPPPVAVAAALGSVVTGLAPPRPWVRPKTHFGKVPPSAVNPSLLASLSGSYWRMQFARQSIYVCLHVGHDWDKPIESMRLIGLPPT
jgi:hypothetical protein